MPCAKHLDELSACIVIREDEAYGLPHNDAVLVCDCTRLQQSRAFNDDIAAPIANVKASIVVCDAASVDDTNIDGEGRARDVVTESRDRVHDKRRPAPEFYVALFPTIVVDKMVSFQEMDIPVSVLQVWLQAVSHLPPKGGVCWVPPTPLAPCHHTPHSF